jgi:glycine cleavage system T protein (aminomethyltransferase)
LNTLLKRTPLYETHKALGARIVEFAGWEMPVQYSGVIEEHLAVRTNCGLFDVSHMGEVEITGEDALAVVQRLITNDVERVVDGQCQYTAICYPDGGVVDDCIVYRFDKKRFFVCVNASNTEKAFKWMRENGKGAAAIRDVSANYAQLALQGPFSVEVIRPLLSIDPEAIKHFHFAVTPIKGFEAIISRTGYTGEDGFELYFDPRGAVAIWRAIMESGKKYGILPIGLGARDTLRLEMGYPLYGHELSETITPLEAGLKKYVRLDKPDFIGKEALVKQASALTRTLVGIKMSDPGVPRAGYEIEKAGKKAGYVTSGTLSPSLKLGIAMCLVGPGLKEPGTELDCVIRDRKARAVVTKLPFYKKKEAAGTAN